MVTISTLDHGEYTGGKGGDTPLLVQTLQV